MKPNALKYLDLLPVRPQPIQYESYSSYMSRVGKANGLLTWQQLQLTLGINQPLNRQFDIWRTDFGQMPQLLGCSEATLRAMTPHFLRTKFDRTYVFRDKFFFKSVSDSLRYCPICVKENGYRLLEWQFVHVRGCCEHGCQLQTGCPHCQQDLPAFLQEMTQFLCPTCGKDITDCDVQPLSQQDWLVSDWRRHDLRALFTPQDLQHNLKPNLQFVSARQRLGLSLTDVARQLCVKNETMRRLEETGIGSLEIYMSYADVLGRSVYDILYSTPVNHDEQCSDQPVHAAISIRRAELKALEDVYEAELLHKVQQAIQKREDKGESWGQNLVGLDIGVRVDILINYPRVKAYLDEAAIVRNNSKRQKREDMARAIHDQLVEIIKKAQQENVVITIESMSEQIGVDVQKLRQYLWIDELLASLPTAVSRHGVITINVGDQSILRTSEWVYDAIKAIIEAAEATDTYLTKGEIVRQVGVSRYGTLNSYPEISKILQQHVVKGQEKVLNDRIARVREIEQEMLKSGKRVTSISLATAIGMTWTEVQRYPQLYAVVEDAGQRYKQQREQELLAATQGAIAELRATGTEISLNRIGDKVGLAPANLKRYPLILAYLNSVPELPQLNPPKPRSKLKSS